MSQHHHLTINEHQLVALEYNEHLDSVPVIFIHGILNSVYLWEPIQIPLINDNYHWYSLSLPGHYPAILPNNFKPQDLTPQMMAEVMAEAVNRLTQGQPAIIIGYSTGAYASLCLTHHAPHLVKRLLLLEGFAKGVWGNGLRLQQLKANLRSIASTFIHQPYGKLNKPSLMVTHFGYNLVGTDLEAIDRCPQSEAVIQSNWKTLHLNNLKQVYPYFRHLFHQDISDWLPDIDIETLILHGDKDRVIIPQHAEYINQHLPNSDLQWLKGSGHLPFLERATSYEDYLTDWLIHE